MVWAQALWLLSFTAEHGTVSMVDVGNMVSAFSLLPVLCSSSLSYSSSPVSVVNCYKGGVWERLLFSVVQDPWCIHSVEAEPVLFPSGTQLQEEFIYSWFLVHICLKGCVWEVLLLAVLIHKFHYFPVGLNRRHYKKHGFHLLSLSCLLVLPLLMWPRTWIPFITLISMLISC